MVENLYNFEKVLKHISVNEDIFKPNLTTKLSIEAAQDELKNNIQYFRPWLWKWSNWHRINEKFS